MTTKEYRWHKPLEELTEKELEEFCKEFGVPYVVTNKNEAV